MQKLVSRKKHRDAVSEHEQAEEILCLPLAQRECLVGKQFVPFDSAVETIAVSRSICILVPVCLVVAVFLRKHGTPKKASICGEVLRASTRAPNRFCSVWG